MIPEYALKEEYNTDVQFGRERIERVITEETIREAVAKSRGPRDYLAGLGGD